MVHLGDFHFLLLICHAVIIEKRTYHSLKILKIKKENNFFIISFFIYIKIHKLFIKYKNTCKKSIFKYKKNLTMDGISCNLKLI